MKFVKYLANGNDFIFIDSHVGHNLLNDSTKIKLLCDRHKGIGGDGLILADTHKKKMFFFNPDGHEAKMCGNGARCFLDYMWQQDTQYVSEFFVWDEKYKAIIDQNKIWVQIKIFPQKLNLEDFKSIKNVKNVFFINLGVPHIVFHLSQLEKIDFVSWARKIRFDKNFPQGTNVNVIDSKKNNVLNVRTYERGVEAETLSCGTGIVASAMAALNFWGWDFPIKVKTQAGFAQIQKKGEDIFFSGEVSKVFTGTFCESIFL